MSETNQNLPTLEQVREVMEPLRTIYGDGDRFEEAVAGSLEIAIKTGDFDLQTMKASVLMMLGVLDFLKSDSPVLFIIR